MYYAHGLGVEKNLGKAVFYLLEAHHGGSRFAAYQLADMYEKGRVGLGFEKDPELALKFHSAVATNKIRDLAHDWVQKSAEYVAKHTK